jgi:hypothetical protein
VFVFVEPVTISSEPLAVPPGRLATTREFIDAAVSRELVPRLRRVGDQRRQLDPISLGVSISPSDPPEECDQLRLARRPSPLRDERLYRPVQFGLALGPVLVGVSPRGAPGRSRVAALEQRTLFVRRGGVPEPARVRAQRLDQFGRLDLRGDRPWWQIPSAANAD